MRIKSAENRITDTRKGFTMVELIVVLVVLAIIAAFIIPALLGFIDKGKESEYKAHAEAALAATQTALSDLYNDASSSYTPVKRESTRKLAGAPEDTAFTVWTEKVLWDGRTKALESEIASYTIIKAIYKENENVYMYYDGAEWTKYDNERDAKKAAVGVDGEDNTNSLGDNVIFVWPYKRDYAYLTDKEGDPDPQQSPDGPIIKIVTFHTDRSLLSQAYFQRVGKPGSSVRDSVKVVFWKNGDTITSDYWDGTVFTENENYQYTFHTSTSVNLGGWLPNSEDNHDYICVTKDDVIDYIFNLSPDEISEFDFYADLYTNGKVDEVTLGKSQFRSFVDSFGSDITGIEKVELSDDEIPEIGSFAENYGAQRVDDNENRRAMIYAWVDGSTVKWCTNALVAYMPADCSDFFKGGDNLVGLDFSEFDSSRVTDVSGMFAECENLQEVTLGGSLASAGITDVSEMFAGCTVLSSVDSSSIGSGTLTSVYGMFKDCSSLTGDIIFADSFNTSSIESFEDMFVNCGASNIDAGKIDTSSATSLKNMFKDCSNLGALDVSGWNVSKVRTLEGTFSGCSNLSLTVDGWSLGECTNLNNTFNGCSSLGSMDMSALGLSGKLTGMNSTFRDCSGLTSITFPENFDTTSVSSMENLFNGCSSISELNLMMFDTRNVTGFTGMFNGMTSLTTIYASLDFVVNSDDVVMFEGDENLFGGHTHYSDELSSKDTSKYAWIDMRDKKPGYFYGLSFKAVLSKSEFQKLFKQETRDVVKVDYGEHEFASNVFNVTDATSSSTGSYIYAWRDGTTVKWCTNALIAYMPPDCSKFFQNNTNLYKFSFRGFDTSLITTMDDMFGCTADGTRSNLSEIDFGDDFRTDSLTILRNAFRRCIKLESLDLSGWDVSNVTDLTDTFARCKGLKEINLSGWDVSNVKYMQSTFRNCEVLTYLDLSTWHTDSLETMQQMFFQCYKLKTVKFDNWNAENLLNVSSTFNSCSSLETIDLSGWDTSKVRSTANMFNGCTNLKTVDLSGWTTVGIDGTVAVSVTNSSEKTSGFENMFNGCSKLTTIYETQDFVFVKNIKTGNMFNGCNSLVGGAGTQFSASGNGNKPAYARIDDPENGKPGYFTMK